MRRSAADSAYMSEAVALARKARPSPNPRVGAVIVRADGTPIGRGYHRRPGEAHAEIVALNEAKEAARGATLYVTLEPCVHFGRTGPCADAVIRAGIARVVVGMTDPDPRVNGAGIDKLRSAGIEVSVGTEEAACRALLAGYATHRRLGRPKVLLKSAITLDGYIATTEGDSKWISSDESRRLVHGMRADADAVLVGIETVLADNPALTVRDAPGISPARVVVDSTLRIPEKCELLRDESGPPVIVAHSRGDSKIASQLERRAHVSVVRCKENDEGRPDICDLVRRLGDRGVLSLVVEGGRRVTGAFLKAGTVDEIVLFIAPKVLGSGIPWTDYPGAPSITDALAVSPVELRQIGGDILYRASVTCPG